MTKQPSESRFFTRAGEIERVCSEQMLMDIDLHDRNRCHFAIQNLQLPDMGLSLFSGSTSTLTRNWSQASQASQDLVMCIAYAANVRVSRAGIDEIYLPGQAHVWLGDQGTCCEVDDEYSAIMVTLPGSSLSHLDVDCLLDRGITRSRGELELFVYYARGVAQAWDSLSLESSSKVASHLRDLATTVLITEGCDIDAEGRSSIRAARLARVKADIHQHLSLPELSPAWIAAREGISNRYLRDLLADEGTNFRQLVLDLRLETGYQRLSDPRFRQHSVSAIAFGCGFGDLSYFCRAFKRRFAATPTEIRLRSLGS